MCARYVRKGIALYDPAHVRSGMRQRCLMPVEVNVTSTRNNARHQKALKGAQNLLSEIFDYSEAGRLCGGKMHFTQLRPGNGGSHRKGVSFSGLHKGSIKLMVQADGNETCFEYVLRIPDISDPERFIDCVRLVVEESGNVRRPYNIPSIFLQTAEDVVARVKGALGLADVADEPSSCIEPSEESHAHVLPVITTTEQPLENEGGEQNAIGGSSSAALQRICSLDDEEILLILLEVEKNFGIEAMIPRTEFTAILIKELGVKNPEKGGHISGYIKYLKNRKFPIIMQVKSRQMKHSQGYLLTPQAKEMLARAHGNQQQTGTSDLLDLPQAKAESEETVQGVTQEMSIQVLWQLTSDLQMAQKQKMQLRTRIDQIACERDDQIREITSRYETEVQQAKEHAIKLQGQTNERVTAIDQQIAALQLRISGIKSDPSVRACLDTLLNATK